MCKPRARARSEARPETQLDDHLGAAWLTMVRALNPLG